jgi:hypothetical protein
MASKKHTEVKDMGQLGFGLPTDLEDDISDFSSEQISFPPYWKPEIGKKFLALAVSLDERDPEFLRYLLQATHDIMCSKGGRDDKEDILVKRDEFFTMSVYAGLPLSNYIGLKCLVEVTGTKDTGKPNDMFVFDLKLSKADKAMLSADRRTRAQLAIQQYNASKRQSNGAAPKEMTGEVVNKGVPATPFG